jgi:hypothetical protein
MSSRSKDSHFAGEELARGPSSDLTTPSPVVAQVGDPSTGEAEAGGL